MLTRRQALFSLPAGLLAAAGDWRAAVRRYLESLARPGGGYAFEGEQDAHLTPTYFVVGCYRLLGVDPPRRSELAEFVRRAFPLPERRLKERPLRRFRFEQVQTLLWLDEPVDDYREEVAAWTGPSRYDPYYEHSAFPVFNQETAALRCRILLGLPPTDEWRHYILSRRRPDGSFNNTPASDGSPGHILNTFWGLTALRDLGLDSAPPPALRQWVNACQLPSGGFTWRPQADPAGVDDAAYTWAAVQICPPERRQACIRWLQSLFNRDGGFGCRPGRLSNPMATYYAVSALSALGAAPGSARTPISKSKPAPAGLNVYTIQIQAPGQGSPADAVEMARSLRIHLWGAKNAPQGWLERAQEIADRRKAGVRFFPANEEYGTYVSLPGLGAYSHLADLVAPPGADFGPSMANKEKPWPWQEFRDIRIRRLRQAGGRMIWQFNENEELTRILLDEALEKGTYAAISSFHFGNENFLRTQPFLLRYRELLPFVALQDAHTREPWWWADQLEGFRTVFLARQPDWQGWLEALDKGWVMAICADARTNFQTRFAGGSEAVRRVVSDWWAKNRALLRVPAATVVAVRASDPFEDAKPAARRAVRLRCRYRNSTQGLPLEPLAELIALQVDGKRLEPERFERKDPKGRLADCYYLAPLPDEESKLVEAVLKNLKTGATERVTAVLDLPQ